MPSSLAATLCLGFLLAPTGIPHASTEDLPPLLIDQQGHVEVLPEKPGDHWIWVSDMVWTAMTDGRATLFDADTGAMLGMLSTGYSFNALTIPSTYREIYSAETYYSRHTRGERVDVVSVYDARNLALVTEIPIPPKRASTTPKVAAMSITDDDRFMAVWNYTPAQSLTIVDLARRAFVTEIPIPGCALAYPVGERAFFTLCGNGTVLLLTLTDAGELRASSSSRRFFDPENDPVTEKGVRSGGTWYLPSYAGILHELSLVDDTLVVRDTWPLFTDAQRGDGWKIGGIQYLAIHHRSRSLYSLVHQGGKDSHHQPGTEVWVHDIPTRTLKKRLQLKSMAASIAVSQDDEPLLYTVIPDVNELQVYDAITGRHKRRVSEVSITPSLLQLPISQVSSGN